MSTSAASDARGAVALFDQAIRNGSPAAGTDVREWLTGFAEALAAGDGAEVASLFVDGGLWRDFLAFGWTLATHEGRDGIAALVDARAAATGASGWTTEAAEGATEGFIGFETSVGRGSGYVRLLGGRCLSLFTMLDELKGFGEPLRRRRPIGVAPDDDKLNWKDRRERDAAALGVTRQPYVVVVGAGQSGLALAARLKMLDVPCLLVDKRDAIGGQWRSRYKSLSLHDPVWYDHMPYLPFPDHWPVFTPKDKLADWLEAYAQTMELDVWNSTECIGARYEEEERRWSVLIDRGGRKDILRPRHLVVAVGQLGFPRTPEIGGRELFGGPQHHSSAHADSEGCAGERVAIIGSNNSAHDIAADLVRHGAFPTIVQRSSTLIVRQSTMTDFLMKPYYSQEAVDGGLTTERADVLAASLPIRLQEPLQRFAWEKVRVAEAPFYDRLTEVGFRLDFGEDGTGLAMKFQRANSGFYIDVGACEMIADGRIAIRSGVEVEAIDPDGIWLSDGSHLPVDRIIYATGFGAMEEGMASLVGPEIATRLGRCGGYGSGFKGDPGPWEGELRNMWKPTAQEGLWFMGGNLAQGRFYSRLLALQLKARLEGLRVEPFAPTSGHR